MDVSKGIVKARPGVVGGHAEEKRSLRERVVLPIDRGRWFRLWASSGEAQRASSKD
jgi:hypothetical protein